MGDHDHHAEQQRDGVVVDRPEGVLERQGAEGDHRRPAQERDAGAVEPKAGNAAEREARIGQDQDRQGGEDGRSQVHRATNGPKRPCVSADKTFSVSSRNAVGGISRVPAPDARPRA